VQTSTEEVDNGHDASGVYRGGKYQIYEGGTRVPFIVSWPAKIKPGVSNALVNQVDFLSSLADLVGIKLEENEGIDSRNTLDAYLGKSNTGLPSMIEEATKTRAIRRGEWKFIPAQPEVRRAPKTDELYNLTQDPGEQNNVAEKYPEIVEAMAKELNDLLNGKSIRKESMK